MQEDIKKEPENSPLEELQKKADEYLNNWKRAAADMANYKKDEIERMAMLSSWAKESMILKILPIFDSFYLAERHANILKNVSMEEWQKGFEQIKNQISEFLKKEGIEEIITIGKLFDANEMESLGEMTNSQFPIPNTVVEQMQKGYKMGDKILRVAKVKVSK